MKLVVDYFRELGRAALDGWNRFWFTPADGATLCFMRILAGAMLFYTHYVWGRELDAFFSDDGYVPPGAAAAFYGDSRPYALSYLWYVHSPFALQAAHYAALVVLAMFACGLYTRVTSILAFVITVSYANRVPGALFGLDQINVMLATYLMLAPCGAEYSLDRRWAIARAGGRLPPVGPSVMANVATRLIQLHMCIIYFFAGLGKLQGDTWWEGTALWGAAFNLEYQTVDLTWLVHYPVLTAFLTQATAYWELFFCVLIWPRLLRPITAFVAIPLHLSIGICMGLMTFGLVMPIGVMSFVSPTLVRRFLDRNADDSAPEGGVGQGGAVVSLSTSPDAPRKPARRA